MVIQKGWLVPLISQIMWHKIKHAHVFYNTDEYVMVSDSIVVSATKKTLNNTPECKFYL